MIERVLSIGQRLLKRARRRASSAPDAGIVRLSEEVARITDSVDTRALERHIVASQALAQAELNIGSKLDKLSKGIEIEIDRLDGFLAFHANRLTEKITETRGELTLLKWMIGFNLAITLAIVSKLFLSGH